MLYAGLARPQALYVIASDGKTSHLYRGPRGSIPLEPQETIHTQLMDGAWSI